MTTPDPNWTPVNEDNCRDLPGPFYHGTKIALAIGDLLTPGHPSNYRPDRVLKHIYFSALLEPAIWGAELSVAQAGIESRGHLYIVEPTGPFADDPNLTNKRFPGNPTQSYRSTHPLKVVAEVRGWVGHSPATLDGMLASIRERARSGLDLVED